MLLGQIKRAVRRYGLLERGDRIVVGVSGGPDSMALLHALGILGRASDWQVHAAHLHHALRGEAADRDLALVEAYAGREGVPLITERLAPGTLAGPGIEARARKHRYAFLHRVAGKIGAGRIATGHTMDDQAETVLMRLLRGSGTRGLAGIRPRRADGVIRPLLLATRSDIMAFLEGAGVAYREDETNRDPRYLRNRVRHDLMPLLLALSPRITERLAKLAERLRADEAYLSAEARRLGSACQGTAGSGRVQSDQLLKLPEAIRSRVLLALMAEAGAAPDRVAAAIDRIEEHLAPGAAPGGLDLGGNLQLRWDDEGLRVGPAALGAQQEGDRRLIMPGTTPLADGRAIRATIHPEPGEAGRSSARAAPDEGVGPAQAFFDLAALSLPLRVRTRRPGDRMRPRGFGRWRKLKDVLIDARVPRVDRERVPVVVSGDEVVWAGGVRASELGRPTAGTARILKLELLGPDGAATPAGPSGEK